MRNSASHLRILLPFISYTKRFDLQEKSIKIFRQIGEITMLMTNRMTRKKKSKVAEGQLNLFDLMLEAAEPLITQVENTLERVEETLIEVAEIEHSFETFETLDVHEIPVVTPQNFCYDPSMDLVAKTPKQKTKRNIEAIQLLHRLEAEDRYPTPEEQLVLARYVGWGGLADALTEGKKGWEKEYQQLQTLLSPEEFASAQESTVTAFYTEPFIIQAIYRALERFGFKGGNLLEPACGIGAFFAALPESLRQTVCYGVELDQISGRIAQKLYPNASIQVKGYERTTFPDQFFDVAVGNIPFNNFKIHDPKYDKHSFLIHDYFIAKTLDQVRPGGIIAFITSKGTLDKQNSSIRRYISERADLIGAIRLPDTAFKALAGTEATADILFLQKRTSLADEAMNTSWIDLGQVNDVVVNRYFEEHPDMILGEMVYDAKFYGAEVTTCRSHPKMDLEQALNRCIDRLQAEFVAVEVELDEDADVSDENAILPATEQSRNYSYVLHNGEIYYREHSVMIRQNVTGRRADRLKGMIELHDLVRGIITCQTSDARLACTDDTFQIQFEGLLAELNQRYDAFVAEFGYLNSKTNVSVFAADSGAPLLQSIEVEVTEDEDVYEKGIFFFKPTVQTFELPTQAETPEEALRLSLSLKGGIDLPWMCELCSAFEGREVTAKELTNRLENRVFLDPAKYQATGDWATSWVSQEAYLSGLVVDKLNLARQAALTDDRFKRNVEALEGAQPTPLQADEISFILGSTWIPVDYYREFLAQLFQIPMSYRWEYIDVEYSDLANTYQVKGKSMLNHTLLATQTYGTTRIDGFKIFEDTLNLKAVEVKDLVEVKNAQGDWVERYVINQQETLLAREKQALIKSEFESWLFEDKDRAEAITAHYNDLFNNIRPRHYDGSDLVFPGMNPNITLESHQRNVIAQGLYSDGNLLIAQEVGAGKTYSAITIGHEMKRLGLIQKPLYVVPNHLVGQWAREYLTLYPTANILVASKKDLAKKNRRRFVSRMATGDFDAVIIAQSSFELIAMSPAYQERVMKDELDELDEAISSLRASGERGNYSLKQAMLMKKKLEAQLLAAFNADKKDDLIYFEELGVDCLIVDEAHAYKNNFTHTKLKNVAGLGNTRSQRAMDMFMKVQYVNERNDGRGVVYLTGTPVSNSMSELHVLQKTLQPEALRARGILNFDAWASTFGRIESSLEIKPEGNGYQLKQRFARFHNLPELMNLFSLIADIKTSDMLNLPTPELKGGKPTVIKTPITPDQLAVVQEHGVRAEAIRAGQVDSSEDNFLKLTLEARLNAIDPRILDESIPYHPETKLNVCAKKVAEIYHQTTSQRATQIIFCDQGTPKEDAFNFYDTLREELVKLGVETEEIRYIHEAKTEPQRLALFDQMIKGEIRVLIGSTGKMGTGVNVQNKLIALHHLDIPWRPADLTQRNGRILRRGNEHEEVMIFNYITEDTFDGYLWQILEQKQRYISQIMTGRSPLRTCEDLDQTTLQYAEFKALAIADPRIKRKMEVDNEVSRLTLLKSMWMREQSRLNKNIKEILPDRIKNLTGYIEATTVDVQTYLEAMNAPFSVELNGMVYTERDMANQAIRNYLNETNLSIAPGEYRCLGTYLGFEFGLTKQSFMTGTELYFKGAAIRRTRFVSTRVLAQLDALAKGLPTKLEEYQLRLEESRRELETAQTQVLQPFMHDAALKELQAEKIKLDLDLEFEQVS